MNEIIDAIKGQVIVDAQELNSLGEVGGIFGSPPDYGLRLTLGSGRTFNLLARMWTYDDCELFIEEVFDEP